MAKRARFVTPDKVASNIHQLTRESGMDEITTILRNKPQWIPQVLNILRSDMLDEKTGQAELKDDKVPSSCTKFSLLPKKFVADMLDRMEPDVCSVVKTAPLLKYNDHLRNLMYFALDVQGPTPLPCKEKGRLLLVTKRRYDCLGKRLQKLVWNESHSEVDWDRFGTYVLVSDNFVEHVPTGSKAPLPSGITATTPDVKFVNNHDARKAQLKIGEHVSIELSKIFAKGIIEELKWDVCGIASAGGGSSAASTKSPASAPGSPVPTELHPPPEGSGKRSAKPPTSE